MPSSSDTFPPSKGAYRLVEQIGHGKTSKIYRATCLPADQEVAIKIVDTEKVENLEALQLEISTMVQSRHPNIVPLYCTFSEGKDLWLVTKLYSGGSVQGCMRWTRDGNSAQQLDEEVAIAILYQVLNGLSNYHKEGRIHRNLRSSTLLLDLDGNIGLEMSLAASNENWDRQKTRNTFVGDPGWMAPEMLQQEAGYDFKADIWALGITAYELAEGKPPYPHERPLKVMMMVMHQPPPKTTCFGNNYSDFVQKCLVKEPDERPNTDDLLKHVIFKKYRSSKPSGEQARQKQQEKAAAVVKPFVRSCDLVGARYQKEQEESHSNSSTIQRSPRFYPSGDAPPLVVRHTEATKQSDESHPVLIEQTVGEEDEVLWDMSILTNVQGQQKTVDFQFNPQQDTAEEVASEMAEELSLDKDETRRVQNAIVEKLNEWQRKKGADPQKGLKIDTSGERGAFVPSPSASSEAAGAVLTSVNSSEHGKQVSATASPPSSVAPSDCEPSIDGEPRMEDLDESEPDDLEEVRMKELEVLHNKHRQETDDMRARHQQEIKELMKDIDRRKKMRTKKPEDKKSVTPRPEKLETPVEDVKKAVTPRSDKPEPSSDEPSEQRECATEETSNSRPLAVQVEDQASSATRDAQGTARTAGGAPSSYAEAVKGNMDVSPEEDALQPSRGRAVNDDVQDGVPPDGYTDIPGVQEGQLELAEAVDVRSAEEHLQPAEHAVALRVVRDPSTAL